MKGTRQRKKNETRERLFTAAIELFAKHGYHTTTIEKIAARAEVAKGTFFVHFASKDAVVAALVRIQTGAARKARARALEASGPIAALHAATMTLGELAGQNRTLSRAVVAATLESHDVGGAATAMFDEVAAEMRADARAAKAAKLLRPRVDPDVLVASLVTSYLGAVLHFSSNASSAPLLELLEPLVDATLAGATRA